VFLSFVRIVFAFPSNKAAGQAKANALLARRQKILCGF